MMSVACVCVCACVRACVRACVCVCVQLVVAALICTNFLVNIIEAQTQGALENVLEVIDLFFTAIFSFEVFYVHFFFFAILSCEAFFSCEDVFPCGRLLGDEDRQGLVNFVRYYFQTSHR